MKVSLVDVFGLGAILAWGGLSIYSLLQGYEEVFQRLGTVGIAAGILYFAFVRHAPEFSNVVRERLISLRKRQHQNIQGIDNANRAIALLAFELKKVREDLGLSERAALNRFVARTIQSMETQEPFSAAKTDAGYSSLDEQEENANKDVEFQRRFSQMFEVWVVVVATLQTGFGDYLVRFVGGR